jgi:hypothetical protein
MIEAARPTVSLIAKADDPQDSRPRSPFSVKLTSQDDMPIGDALMFSLKSTQPFPRSGRIEIASPDDSLHTALSVSDVNGSLILEGPTTLLANLQPLKAFGPSAFGPIRLRAVAPDGAAGDWLPLVTLVRLPTLTSLICPQAAPVAPTPPARRPRAHHQDVPTISPDTPSDAPVAPASEASPSPPAPNEPAAAPAVATPPPASCTLTGAGLYFIDAIATDDSFANPTRVPEGFVGSSLAVPPPTGAVYYLRLRDDPIAIDTLTLPAGPL